MRISPTEGPWARAAAATPDPLGALMAAERFLDGMDPETQEAISGQPGAAGRLAWFLAACPGLVPFLVRHPETVVRLFLRGEVRRGGLVTPGAPEREAFLEDCECAPDVEALGRTLARFRNTHLVRLYAQEIFGLRPCREIWREWSEVASCCIQGALNGARGRLPEGGQGVRLVVLGMGKLGGEELNFASDIDLIYLYEAGGDLAHGRVREVAVQWARGMTSILEKATDEGPSYRVDLGLRPGGKDGDLVLTVDAAEIYYQTLASPWERWALIKAMPVAGDAELGRTFLEMVRPFVYRRYLDYGSLEDIRTMKGRIQREVRWKTIETTDVKLGRGGIREVEFLVQTLQIIHGGKFPELRRRDTLGALEILMNEGLLPVEEGHGLRDAYLFLRGVEHRVQMVHHRQTQRLPTNDRELRRIAGLMGYADGENRVNEFLADLRRHMEAVHQAFEGLVAAPGQEKETEVDPRAEEILVSLEDEEASPRAFAEAGFKEPHVVGASLRRILGDRFPASRSARSRQALLRLFPKILSWVIATPSPDQTLFRLERFLEAVGPRGGYYALLEQNPSTLERLIGLFARSAMLSRWLTEHLDAVDGLVERGQHRPRRTRVELWQEAERLLAAVSDPEERLGRLRLFRAQEFLRIGVGDLWGALNPWDVGEELTVLAEVFLEVTLHEVLRSFGHQPANASLPLCILALGSFGGRELSYRSDLDLMFLHEDRGGWHLPNGASPVEHLTRIGQRVLSWMSVPMKEGPGWAMDTRLRPSGSRGPLMVSLEAFRHYHEGLGRTWERQMLLKARPCTGNPDTCEKVMGMIDRFLTHAPPPDPQAFHEMRMRMERERRGKPKEGIHLKLGPGGMADIEFLVQFHQLRRWPEDPEVRVPGTFGAIRSLTGSRVFERPEGQALEEAHGLLKGVEHRLGLILDHKGTDQACTWEELRALGPVEEIEWAPSPQPGEGFPEILARVMAGVREIYLRRLIP